jgi:hypothetical protein
VAETTRSTFRQPTSVHCLIQAPAAGGWSLLTDAPRFSAWNSTVTRGDQPDVSGRSRSPGR